MNHSDVFAYSTNEPFDALLSLWCGIGDFTPQEQLGYFAHMFSLLKNKGVLYLDTSTWCIQPINTEYLSINSHYLSKQYYQINEQEFRAQGYIPTINEVKDFAKLAGFQTTMVIRYKTTTNRDRFMYILVK